MRWSGFASRCRTSSDSLESTMRAEFAFERHGIIFIVSGPSGAGKTTLLDCIAGLTEPDQGRIVAGGTVLLDSEQGINSRAIERKIGYVFQDLALFPHLTVEANVGYGLGTPKAEDRKQRVADALESLGISELGARRPAEPKRVFAYPTTVYKGGRGASSRPRRSSRGWRRKPMSTTLAYIPTRPSQDSTRGS